MTKEKYRCAGELAARILFPLFVFWFLVWTIGWFNHYDETDSEELGERSGAQLIIDYGTGCQYLSKMLGGMTPRVDGNGKHVCRGTE